MSEINRYAVVIVIHEKEIESVVGFLPIINRNLNPYKIVIISGKKAEERVKALGEKIEFIQEDKLLEGLTYDAVKREIAKRRTDTKRTGWYFQQFIKMAYALKTMDEWYLLWDSDTLPLNEINPFEDGKPVFDVKTEFHRPYFYTIEKLLSIEKQTSESFVAEHMLIKREYMIELLNEIETNTDCVGDVWWKKIINTVSYIHLTGSGFSEFETYGNYIMAKHPTTYKKRKLRTLREAKRLVNSLDNPSIQRWAAKSYDIVSFERYHRTNKIMNGLANSLLRYFVSMESMWNFYKRRHPAKYYE